MPRNKHTYAAVRAGAVLNNRLQSHMYLGAERKEALGVLMRTKDKSKYRRARGWGFGGISACQDDEGRTKAAGVG